MNELELANIGNAGDKPNKGDDVDCRRVVGFPQEFHQSMYNAGRNFGEFDRADVDRLNQKLPVI